MARGRCPARFPKHCDDLACLTRILVGADPCVRPVGIAFSWVRRIEGGPVCPPLHLPVELSKCTLDVLLCMERSGPAVRITCNDIEPTYRVRVSGHRTNGT